MGSRGSLLIFTSVHVMAPQSMQLMMRILFYFASFHFDIIEIQDVVYALLIRFEH